MPGDHTNARDSSTRTKVLVGATVIALVVLALFLRSYWNIDAAQTEDGFVMSAGSDPYYHFRAITYIQENGWSTLVQDPLLNYPYGALNPNPPLFQWSVAVSGAALSPFFGGDTETATWWAMLWAPAVWGALTIIPTYLIGRDVFNRRTGIVAAFLMAVSTSAIDHTSLGAADHDATILFFSVTAFWAYIRTVQSFRGDSTWIEDWRSGASRSAGFSRFVAERKTGFAWAALSGLLVAAVALTWKGFPYLIGIMFAYVSVQLVVDHWRSKDSLGVWSATLVTFLVAMLVTTPLYLAQDIGSWLKSVWFLIGAFAIFGLVMVPTRDLPTILVLPIFAIVGALGALAAFFAVPDVARSLLYATVYFKQTTLYQTIAEAHPADFATIVFGIGPIAFFLALAGVLFLFWNSRRNPSRANLFMAVWAIVALYMAQSAVRFVFNAVPVMVVLAGWVVILLLDWVDFAAVGKSMRQTADFWTGLKRSVGWMHVTMVVLVAALLVFPSVFLAVDAATPLAYDAEKGDESDWYGKRFGAFGQGFLPTYWQEGLAHLRGLDDYGSVDRDSAFAAANRPAFISWWDYGHWAIQVGEHPAVADNFQNGYEFAANYLLSQNETQAVQLMSARSMPRTNADGDLIGHGIIDEATSKRLIEEAGVPSDEVEETYLQLTSWQYAPALDIETAVALESLVTDATKTDQRPDGVRIRYFATDVRMLPYDLPSTRFIDQTSIFYAPVTLKGDDPEKYVALRIQGSDGQFYNETAFEQEIKRIAAHPDFTAVSQRYEYQPAFFNSMYYRGFVGTPVDQSQPPVLGDKLNQALSIPQPGYDMKHFRLAYANPQLRILEYYSGAEISGTVTQDGNPLSGVTVTAYDDAGAVLFEELPESITSQNVTPQDFNVPHDSTQTDAEGTYSLTIPFSTDEGTSIVVTDSSGAELARHTLDVTREEANSGAEFTHDFIVEEGTVQGFAFFDENGNGTAEADEDRVGGVTLSIGGVNVTTAADGSFTATDVPAGRQSVSVNGTEYEVSPFRRFVSVQPDETVEHEVALTVKPVTTTGTFVYDADGDGALSDGDLPAAGVTVTFDPEGEGQAVTEASDEDGAFEASLPPGTWRVNATFTADSVDYTTDESVTVTRGQGAFDAGTILLTRDE